MAGALNCKSFAILCASITFYLLVLVHIWLYFRLSNPDTVRTSSSPVGSSGYVYKQGKDVPDTSRATVVPLGKAFEKITGAPSTAEQAALPVTKQDLSAKASSSVPQSSSSQNSSHVPGQADVDNKVPTCATAPQQFVIKIVR